MAAPTTSWRWNEKVEVDVLAEPLVEVATLGALVERQRQGGRPAQRDRASAAMAAGSVGWSEVHQAVPRS